MKNEKIATVFRNNVLLVNLIDGAIVTDQDLEEIYSKANNQSEGGRFGIIFHTLGQYSITEDAVTYIVDNPYNKQIVAKIYVIDTVEAALKTKLHLKFDKPSLQPIVVQTTAEAMSLIKELMDREGA